MAALYGRLQGDDRKERTATGHRSVLAQVETWTGQARLELTKDGKATLYVGHKGFSTGVAVLTVDLDDRESFSITYHCAECGAECREDADTLTHWTGDIDRDAHLNDDHAARVRGGAYS